MIGWASGEWDRCWLGGELLPGIARVTVTPARDVQEVKPDGADAPNLRDQGNAGADVAIECRVWQSRGSDALVRQLSDMLARINPRQPGGLKTPLSIIHPAAAMAGVTEVYCRSYTIQPPDGRYLVVTLACRQWFPEEQTKKTTAQGAPQGGGTPGGDAPLPPIPEPDPDNVGASFA